MNPDDVEEIKRRRLEGDEQSIAVTAYQAQKCAAILEAYFDGQTLYHEQLNIVAAFLKAASLEAALGRGYSSPSAFKLWEQLDELNWPRHGGSRPQPE